MPYHYHVVQNIDQTHLDQLTDVDVIERWGKLYSLPPSARQYRQQEPMSELVNRLGLIGDSLVRVMQPSQTRLVDNTLIHIQQVDGHRWVSILVGY